MNENKIPQMLTIKEASILFGVSEYLLRTQAKQGAFPAIVIGRKILINRDKLAEYLNTNRISPDSSHFQDSAPGSANTERKPDKGKTDSKLVRGLTPIRIWQPFSLFCVQELFNQKSAEIGERINIIVIPDVAVKQLYAEMNIAVFVGIYQCPQGLCPAIL